MRFLSSFALNSSLIVFYLQTIQAHIPSQKHTLAVLETSELSHHHDGSTLQSTDGYRYHKQQRQEHESPPLSYRSLPLSGLQKRGQSQSKASKKSEQSPPPTPPRIISVATLGTPSLSSTPSIPIPGSSSRSRQSASSFQRSSRGGSTPGSTPLQRPSSFQRTSGGSSIPGSAPLQRLSTSSPSESGRGRSSPISGSELGSSPSQTLPPAVQRANARNALVEPQRVFRRPGPRVYYSSWETNSGPGTPRTSSQRSSQSNPDDIVRLPSQRSTRSNPDDAVRVSSQRTSRFNPNDTARLPSQGLSRLSPEANVGNSPRRPETIINRPPSETVRTSVRTGRHDVVANPSQRSDTQRENPGRSNSPTNPIPPSNPRNTLTQLPPSRIPVGSVFTQPPTNPIPAESVFTQPAANPIPRGDVVSKRPSSPNLPFNSRSIASQSPGHSAPAGWVFTQPPSNPIPAGSVFTHPPRGTSPVHERQSGPSTSIVTQPVRQATAVTQPIKAPPATRAPPPTPPSSEALMRANKATSNFYRNLASLPRTDNPEQNAKKARWGLLSKVHGLASDFYAQDPKASTATIRSTTVPAVLESAPDPVRQAVHRTTANFYDRLATNPTAEDPLSAAQQDELRLLAKYHSAASKYYAEPR